MSNFRRFLNKRFLADELVEPLVRNVARRSADYLANGAYSAVSRAASSVMRNEELADDVTDHRRIRSTRLRRPVSTFRRRRFFKRRSGRRRVSRSVKNPYRAGRKPARAYNKGAMNLLGNLQSGGSLPKQTWARFLYRAKGFTKMTDPTVSPGSLNGFVLNDISGSIYGSTDTDSTLHRSIQFLDFWKSLYNKYLVLGAKGYVKITPSLFPSSMGNFYDPSVNRPLGMNFYDSNPGYYYIQYHYHRGGTEIGPLSKWNSEDEFIIDPSVSWVRERKPKLVNFRIQPSFGGAFTPSYLETRHYRMAKDHNAVGASALNQPVDLQAALQSGGGGEYSGTTQSFEIQQDNRPYVLKFNFSGKKHFQDINYMRNFAFADWSSNIASSYRFDVRIGYIRFANDGKEQEDNFTNRTIGGVDSFTVEPVIRFYAALRDPLMFNDSSLSLMKAMPEEDVVDDLSEIDEEELAVVPDITLEE